MHPQEEQRALSVTQRALNVTQRALNVTQLALNVTQRAQGEAGDPRRALTRRMFTAATTSSCARLPLLLPHQAVGQVVARIANGESRRRRRAGGDARAGERSACREATTRQGARASAEAAAAVVVRCLSNSLTPYHSLVKAASMDD